VVKALAALAESICQGVQWVVSESPRSLCTPGARAARRASHLVPITRVVLFFDEFRA
jgi:hypothetical protein